MTLNDRPGEFIATKAKNYGFCTGCAIALKKHHDCHRTHEGSRPCGNNDNVLVEVTP
jgi:hypothetical protein